MNKNKWNNYFDGIENKYNLKLSNNQPLVIFLDGKDITKSLHHNLISESKNSFNDVLEQVIKDFTIKFNCIAIAGVDEVSFVIEDIEKIKAFIFPKKYKAHNVISMFSQYFYKCFNDKYENGPVYWHCKCSNIPKGKIKSYIKYRSLTIFELKLTYFLKRKDFVDAGKITLSEKEELCNKFPDYALIKRVEKGNLYFNGNLIDLDCFINNEIKTLPELQREETTSFLDITDF